MFEISPPEDGSSSVAETKPPAVIQLDIDTAVNYWAGWSNNVPLVDGEYHPLVLLLAQHRIDTTSDMIPEVECMKQMRETAQELGYIDCLMALEALSNLQERVGELETILRSIMSGEAFREIRFAEDDDTEYHLRRERKVMRLAAQAFPDDTKRAKT